MRLKSPHYHCHLLPPDDAAETLSAVKLIMSGYTYWVCILQYSVYRPDGTVISHATCRVS